MEVRDALHAGMNELTTPIAMPNTITAAATDGTVSAFLEPIALYHTRDLHEPGDGVWTASYEPSSRWVTIASDCA